MDLDKIFEKVPYERIIPLPNWQRTAGFVAMAVVILVIFFFAVIPSKNEDIGELQESHAKSRKEIEENTRDTQNHPKPKAKLKNRGYEGAKQVKRKTGKKLKKKKDTPRSSQR